MSIYSHAPYFYIIKQIKTGKRYAGAKWALDSNPNLFMTETGYQTSSNKVKEIILKEGLNSFSVELIITDFGFGMTAYEYETIFLQTWDIANDREWLNHHNNTSVYLAGTPEYKLSIKSKYGDLYENVYQLPHIKAKIRKNNLDNYGVEFATQRTEVKEKTKLTCTERYGTEFYLNSEDCKIKTKISANEKYGVDYHSQSQIFKDSVKETNLKNWGVENPMQSDVLKEKYKANSLKNHGYDHPSKSPIVKEKRKQKSIESIGVDHFMKTDENRKRQSDIQLGYTWYNNGTKNIRIYKDQTPESNLVKGCLPRKSFNSPNAGKCNIGKSWYYDPLTLKTKFFNINDVTEGWILGRPIKAMVGKIWYHNPATGQSGMFLNDIPEGWIKGRGRRK